MKRVVIFMRAIPGAGKTTKAKQLSKEYKATICSADDYFDVNGKYVFEPSKLGQAHEECFEKFKKSMSGGKNVIIDNTNLRPQDVEKYLDYITNYSGSYEYGVVVYEVYHNDFDKSVEHRTNQESGKNIPLDKMKLMFNTFHQYNLEKEIKKYYGDKIELVNKDDIDKYLK